MKDFHLRNFYTQHIVFAFIKSNYILCLFPNEIDILTQLQKKLLTRYTDLRFRDKKRTNSMTIPAASVVTHVPITVDNEIDILTQLQKKLLTRYTDLRFRDKKRTNSMTIPAASVVTHVPITVDKLNTGRIFSQRCLIWC